MVEQAELREGHDHAVLVAGADDLLILNGTSGLNEVGDTALGSLVDGVTEGEEGIRGDGDALQGGHELVLLLLGEGGGHDIEHLLPLLLLDGGEVALDVADAAVDAVLLLDALLELHAHNLGVLAKVPGLDLAAGELDAINTGLLAGADTDHLTAESIADGVGLGVLSSDGGNNEVDDGWRGEQKRGGERRKRMSACQLLMNVKH